MQAAPQKPRDGNDDDVELPDLSDIDFSKPEACKELKEEHESCFHEWMKRFTRGEVKKDECQVSWRRYQHCVAAKLKYYGLEHLQTEWKRPTYDDLDKIDRINKSQPKN